MKREIVVDSFAGAGGASLGIKKALGRCPDIAINHDPGAIAMHKANHPRARHLEEDVWQVDPLEATRGRPVGLFWCSPDCRHFSRAKGGKPVLKKIRALAWVAIRWALAVRPRIIVLENVREFQDWGPLLPAWRCDACGWRGTEGQTTLARTRRRCSACNSLRVRVTEEQIPDPTRKGLTFKRFAGRLRGLGYTVAWKNLNAADHGAPTHRRRLFLIARRDGAPIVWPEPTHAAPERINDQPLFGPMEPYRTAAEIIDWSLPCKSIFDRRKPLADKTLRRIAMGLKRYVLENPRPFVVFCNHGGPEFRGQDLGEPLQTVTAARDGRGVVTPFLARISQGGGNGKYTNGAGEPLTTVVSKAEHLLISPCLVKHYGGVVGSDLADPLGTVTSIDHHSLIGATLIQTGYGERNGQSPRVPGIDKPLGTAVSGQKRALVAAMLTKFRGESNGGAVDEPLPTVTSGAGAARPAGAAHAMAVTAAHLVRFNHDDAGVPVDGPLPTITQTNHAGLVYAFLVKYFASAVGSPLDTPLHTVTGKHRFGLVMVEVEPGKTEPAVAVDVPGIGPCIIADIGLRMLTPRELARAQGFPDSYVLTGSKSSQVAKIGNSVPPVMAQRIVEANFAPAECLV